MQEVHIDRRDVSIINLLQENSQIPRLELVEQVGLCASQCFRHLKKLEESGVIDRYIAISTIRSSTLLR